jgi:DNA-directed RNA polymerase specialized sigma subunit
VDSLDEPEIDLERELEEWLTKQAAADGISREERKQLELEAWQRWRQDPNPEDFSWLLESHQPLINAATNRYVSSSNLPKAAIKGQIMRRYVKAIDTYDPTKGTQLSTHVTYGLGRQMDRYLQRYSNIGRIPEDRSWLIGTLKQREAELSELHGRPPSDAELADDVLLSMNDLSALRRKMVTPKMVGTLRRELRSDYLAESAGHEVGLPGSSLIEQQAAFLHGSLNPEQQLVLEHTFSGFGKPVIPDPIELGQTINMSPQKVRGIKKQIEKKLDYYYRQANVER